MTDLSFQEQMDGLGDSLAALATDFVTQPETWPVFLAWTRSKSKRGGLPDQDYLQRRAIVGWLYLRMSSRRDARLPGGNAS